ncbi:MAG: hypothetical protein ACPL7M_01665 [Bryobacteraceae bacterium]
MWFVFHAKSPEKQSLFQSAWFVEGLLSQTLIVHVIRMRKLPFVESRASLLLMVTTVAVMMTGLVIPFTRLGASLGTRPRRRRISSGCC